MKLIAILLGLVVYVSAAQEVFKLPKDKANKVITAGKQCAKENNFDDGIIAKVSDGTLPNDDATNKFTQCFATKFAVIDGDGHMIVDKVADYLGSHPLVEQFKEALKKCNEISKENPTATAGAMYRCYSETAPVRFAF